MGVQLNKFRQAFNIFLTLAAVCVVAGIFIYFLTTPEQRNTTFWISMGLLLFSAVLSGLFAARIVYSDSSRQPPHTFTQLMLACLYVVFVILASVFNAFVQMSVLRYFLLHVAGGLVFLLPLQFINMAALKSGGAQQVVREAKNRLGDESARVNDLLSRFGARPDMAGALTPLRKLADNLLYSEPTQASKGVEAALTRTLDEVQVKGELLLSASGEETSARLDDLIRAAVEADRALKARNEAILRSK
ncbi:MAG: hypothetical protein LBR61_09965 [Synergistaceae bacterium]|jgi:hypothetical protein|nr:hypothetical protein [Synergistaceae bacterium]